MSNYQANVTTKVNFGELDKLESTLEKVKKTSITFDVKGSGLSELTSQLKQVQSIAKSMGAIKIDASASGGIDKTLSKLQKIKNEISTAKIDLNMSNVTTSLQKFGTASTKTLEKARTTYSQLKKDLVNLKLAPNSEVSLEYYDKFNANLLKLKNQLKIASNEAKELGLSVSTSAKQFSTLDAVTSSNKTLSWLKNNSKAAKDYGETLQDLAQKQRTATNADDLSRYTKEVNSIKASAQAAGKTGISFYDNFKRGFSQIAQFVGVYGILQKGVQEIQKGFQTITEIDTEFTNLKKVTDNSTSEYASYFNNASNSAKNLGATITDVISSTSEWARLGYGLKDANTLANASILYKNVGDNISAETASTDLISTIKGFGLGADQVESVVDKFNEVGNNFAIGSDGIGTALKKSSATLAQGGNDLDQSIAMITAANEVLQDPETVGTGMKVLSLRLRNTKGKLEELGEDSEGAAESITRLQTQLLNLTKGKVNIIDDNDPTKFKSTYEIMKQMSKVWSSMTDVDQASALELMFGKNRANVGAALLSNFSQAEAALKTSQESAGSAMKENETYLDSIEGKMTQLSAVGQKTWSNLINSDAVKTGVDGLTTMLTLLEKITGLLGSFGTIGAGAGIFGFFKNLDLLKTKRYINHSINLESWSIIRKNTQNMAA